MTEGRTLDKESNLFSGCERGDEISKAYGWCFDCTEPVCKTCSTLHQRLSPPHKVVQIEKVSSFMSSLLTLSRNCENHSDEKIVLFCSKHDKLICSSCLSESHQNCKPVLSIEKAAKDVHEGLALNGLESRMDNLTQLMEKIISVYCTQISSLDEKTKGFKQAVSDLRRNINCHLDKLKADFKIEIDSKYNECNDTLVKNKADTQRRYDTLTTWMKTMSSLKQLTSNVQLFHVIKYLDIKTHGEETRVRNFKPNTTIPTLNFQPSTQMSKICDILPTFGSISVDNSSIPTSIDLEFNQQGQAIVRSEVPKGQIPLKTSFETSKLSYGVKIRNGCFVPENKILLCGQDRNKIYLCDHDGSNTKTIKLDYYPWHVALYDRNTALVAVRDKGIQIIDMKKLKAVKRINVGRLCYEITSLNGNISVNSNDRTLTMIDIKGEIQKKVTTSFNPYSICLGKDGAIYCTDSDSENIYVVTSNGEERVVYNSPGLRDTRGMTVDDHGGVYIAGYRSHNIHRISSDGKQSKIVLSEEDDIKYPNGLSFNHETKELMVVDNIGTNINIYVFTLDYIRSMTCEML